MARNRKRAKERRARQQPARSRSPVPAAEVEEAAPDPIEHATPDVELAEAQLAIGREAPDPDAEPISDEELTAEQEPESEEEFEAEEDFADEEELDEEDRLGEEVGRHRRAAVSEHGPVRQRGRLIGFLQGSWRELQRVQWPDRRQVVQATSVVIGFVIIAGLYLAAADGVAGKVMDAILTGKNKVWLAVGGGVLVASVVIWLFSERDR